MNQEQIGQSVKGEWLRLKVLGYTPESVKVDRFGFNLPPDAPESYMLGCRLSVQDIEVQSTRFRSYEANLLLALRLLIAHLGTINEVERS